MLEFIRNVHIVHLQQRIKTKLAYRVRFFTDFSHKAERVISRLSLNYIIVINRFYIELFSALVLTVLHMFVFVFKLLV